MFNQRLEIDLSESQNQDDLEMIKLLEFDSEAQFMIRSQPKTEQELEEGSISLLKMEIERLKEENSRLANVIQDAEDMTDLYKEEKNKLGEKLLSAQKEISNYKTMFENLPESTNDQETIKEMEEKLSQVENLLSVNMENLEENESIKNNLKVELLSTKEKVKQVEAQLQLAEAVSYRILTCILWHQCTTYVFYF